MRRFKYWCFGLLLAAHASSASSNLPDKVVVSVYHITGMLEIENQTLPYNTILNSIANSVPTQFELNIYHGLRATRTFRAKQADCLFPGSIRVYENESVLESMPINVAKAYFFAFDLKTTERMLDRSAESLRVGFFRGNSFGNTIQRLKHHKLTPLNSGANIRNLIRRGRIDVFLNYMPDSQPYISAAGEPDLLYNESTHFYSQNDSFICHDRPELRLLIEAINLHLQQLKASGLIKQIFTDP